MKALWFSRHSPTEEQLDDINKHGKKLVIDDEISALAADTITVENCKTVIKKITDAVRRHQCNSVYGVFPTLILAESFGLCCDAANRGDFIGREYKIFAAHNIMRTPEGGKPTFHHGGFFSVGVL